MAVQIDLEIADTDGCRAVAMRAPDDGVEIGQKFKPVKRLGKTTIGTGTECGNLVVRTGVAGHHENRDRDMILANQARQSGAVTVRKVDVEQHSIDVVVLEFRKGGLDVVRRRLKMACFFKRHAQNIGDNRIIFYNQDMHGVVPNIKVGQSCCDSPDRIFGGSARRKPRLDR